MLEIVFSESACGALKLAQRYGAGEYHGGAIGVIARNEDGSEPSREELDRLRSLPEDAYDFSIRRALAEVPREFREGRLISDILGKYALGISDGWLAMRIEAMVQSGELAVARKPRRTGCTAACCGARKPKDSGGASFCAAAVFIPFSHIPETVPDCGGGCRSYGR